MKNFLLLVLILTVSCSKSNQKNGEVEQPIVMEMAPETINLTIIDDLLTGIIVDSDSLDFGDVLVGAKATKRITLLAKTLIPTLDTSGFQNSTNFRVVSNSCGSTLLRIRSCTIDLEFSPLAAGSVSELMSLNGSLNFTVEANAVAPVAPPSSDFSNLLTVTPAVDLGTFTGLKKTGKITILNKNSSPVEIVIEAALIEAQGMTHTSYCPAPPLKLKSKSSCQVKVDYLSAVEESVDVPKSANLVINSVKNSLISVLHKSNVTEPAENTNFEWSTNPLNSGTISSQKLQIVYVFNRGSSALTGLSFNSLPTGVSVNRTSCGSTLKSKRQCFVELKLIPSQMTDGPFSFDYNYSNSKTLAKLSISANVSGGTAPVSTINPIIGVWAYDQNSTIELKSDNTYSFIHAPQWWGSPGETGTEEGTFSYNQQTKEFSFSVVRDHNGSLGLSNLQGSSVKLDLSNNGTNLDIYKDEIKIGFFYKTNLPDKVIINPITIIPPPNIYSLESLDISWSPVVGITGNYQHFQQIIDQSGQSVESHLGGGMQTRRDYEYLPAYDNTVGRKYRYVIVARNNNGVSPVSFAEFSVPEIDETIPLPSVTTSLFGKYFDVSHNLSQMPEGSQVIRTENINFPEVNMSLVRYRSGPGAVATTEGFSVEQGGSYEVLLRVKLGNKISRNHSILVSVPHSPVFAPPVLHVEPDLNNIGIMFMIDNYFSAKSFRLYDDPFYSGLPLTLLSEFSGKGGGVFYEVPLQRGMWQNFNFMLTSVDSLGNESEPTYFSYDHDTICAELELNGDMRPSCSP